MWEITHILGRHRRAIVLFALMVLLPASIFSVLIVRALRSERIRVAYDRTERQRHIVRLVEADLNNWLFSTDARSAVSKSLLRFQLAGDQIVFPAFALSLPYAGAPRRSPFNSTPTGDRLTVDSIADQYYPRIQAFLRDLSAGRTSGAQYFLRLRALIVRLPGRDDGYVVEVQPVREHVNERLADFCAGETFRAAVWLGDVENKSPPAANAVALEGFPFFHVIFDQSAAAGLADFRQYAFTYAMALLVLVTILGSIFVHRAVSHEVRLSQLRSDFVAAVSHEFRSPLSSILALSERLESARVRDQEKLSQYHQLIGQDARRLSALVTRLLDFAQIEEGQKVYAFDRVELVAVAREAIQSCHHSVRPDRMQLLGEHAAPLWVHADRTALQHCIQNLIENAGKYSPPDAPITVACAASNGGAVVEVCDHGIGIPLPEQEKIFDKFYRGRQAAELNVQGVGIGLALVRHVAESHGGSVSVESDPGRGSRFRLHLPRLEG